VASDVVDPPLARHVERIDAYVRGIGLQSVPPSERELRRELAAFIMERTPGILPRWIREIGPPLDIAERDWPGVVADQTAATARWARHIADPTDVETYVFLRSHTRHGFIAQFPASRFIASQMRLAQFLESALREAYADDAERCARLGALLVQETRLRVLHITDFFVEGREDLLLEQEASYRRAIDHAPAGILRTDTLEGRVVDANTVAERLLQARAPISSAAVSSICCHPASGPPAKPFGKRRRARHGAARRAPPRGAERPARPRLRERRRDRLRQPPLGADHLHRHVRAAPARSPARPIREDGGDRTARGRHRPRAPIRSRS
jgi:PAS domain-containing protein